MDDVDLDHQVDLNQAAVGGGGGEQERAGGLPAAQERQLKDLKDDKEGESRGEIVGILKKEGSSAAASPNASAVLSHVSRSSKRVSVEVAVAKDAAADKSQKPMRLAGVAEIEGEEVAEEEASPGDGAQANDLAQDEPTLQTGEDKQGDATANQTEQA